MNERQRRWVFVVVGLAESVKHIYPRMAACEAALESDYGDSVLARLGFNLFGMKQHKHSIYGTVNLPTKEYLQGEWKGIIGRWVEYPNIEECFADRMQTLIRLRDVYPSYQAALLAKTPEDYIREVSKTWSTDPQRAEKVLAIYKEVFPVPNNSEEVREAVTGEN